MCVLTLCTMQIARAEDSSAQNAQNKTDTPVHESVLKLPGGYSSLSDVDQLSDELKSHLASNPNGLNLVLAESSQLLKDRMFEKADELIRSARNDYPDSPDLLVRHAEALAGLNGGSLEGEPYIALGQSLDIDHRHKPSLWLMALFNQQIGNHDAALIILNALKQEMGDDSEFIDVVDQSIAVSISFIDHMSSPQKNLK